MATRGYRQLVGNQDGGTGNGTPAPIPDLDGWFRDAQTGDLNDGMYDAFMDDHRKGFFDDAAFVRQWLNRLGQCHGDRVNHILRLMGVERKREEWKMEEISKADFWQKVIQVADGVVRFVGKRDFAAYQAAVDGAKEVQDTFGNEGIYGGSPDAPDELWVPENMFVPTGPDDDFNLVYSLATDGAHYPVLDLDCLPFEGTEWRRSGTNIVTYIRSSGAQVEFKVPVPETGNTVITPSTNGRSHLWSGMRGSWETYLELLAQVPGDDAAKYRKVVLAKGYGALRPPWIKKEAGAADGE